MNHESDIKNKHNKNTYSFPDAIRASKTRTPSWRIPCWTSTASKASRTTHSMTQTSRRRRRHSDLYLTDSIHLLRHGIGFTAARIITEASVTQPRLRHTRWRRTTISGAGKIDWQGSRWASSGSLSSATSGSSCRRCTRGSTKSVGTPPASPARRCPRWSGPSGCRSSTTSRTR